MFKNKVAVITGGGSGIGRATALALAAAGASVIVGNRNREMEVTAPERSPWLPRRTPSLKRYFAFQWTASG